jgi:glutathione S-transferase
MPVLELTRGKRLIQSPAILEYREKTVPTPPLLPQHPVERRYEINGCDGHPLNNVVVLNTLRQLG